MQPRGVQGVGVGVVVAGEGVGGDDVGGVGVGVAEVVCERDGFEGMWERVGRVVEFNHCELVCLMWFKRGWDAFLLDCGLVAVVVLDGR